jgi:hypothetical protein
LPPRHLGLAPTSAAARRGALFRPPAACAVSLALDSNDGQIRTVASPSQGTPTTVEPGRRDGASVGNSMMVPMSVLSDCRGDGSVPRGPIKIRTWLTAS